MKKIIFIVIIIAILICSVCYIEFNVYKLCNNKRESEKTLKIAYNLLEDNKKIENSQNLKKTSENNNIQVINNFENDIQENIILQNEIIGILKIPKLNIEAPIKEGTTQEVMKTSVGHFIESDYWNGNVSLASHNGGTNAHYFKNINILSKDDEIIYITKLGKKTYKIQNICKIKSTDWSMVNKIENINKNVENTITLITCINGQQNYRLCVRGVEIKES